jgi:hypothetical protein
VGRNAEGVVYAEPKRLIDDEVWPTLKRLAVRKTRGHAHVAVPYVTEELASALR